MVFEPIAPMRAVLGPLPHGNDWRYEVKWDGMRLLAHTDGDRLVLRTSNRLDATARFPELAGLVAALGDRPAIVDGELVALDAQGRPSFGELQRRIHLTGEQARRASPDRPVTFVVFDLLHYAGTDARPLRYADRRRLLEQVVGDGDHWTVSGLHTDGQALLEVIIEGGFEGIVAKQIDSVYQSDRRSPSWRKVKVRNRQELVVGAWTPLDGGSLSTLGSLSLGYYSDGRLVPAGRVGTGWNADEARRLVGRLRALTIDTDPFEPTLDDATPQTCFVRPQLVVEIAHGGWTSRGRVRHGSYLGERLDTSAHRVGRSG